MSAHRLRIVTTLAAIAVFALVAGLGSHRGEFGPPRTGAFRPKTETVSGAVVPIQSKYAKDLAAGKLLVANRDLLDPNFAQTVVLLVRYDAKGVLGLVLNRRTKVPISQALEGIKAAKDRSDPVYVGGPVEMPAVLALFQSTAKVASAEHVFDGVYMITDKTLFEQTLSARSAPDVLHVYLGYAGWTQDQLRKEVELGAWYIFPADANTVFNADPDSLWPQMIRKTELKFAGKEPMRVIPILPSPLTASALIR